MAKNSKEDTSQTKAASSGKAAKSNPAGAAKAASAGGENATNPGDAGQAGATAAPNGSAAEMDTASAEKVAPPVPKKHERGRDSAGKVRLRVHSKTARRFRAGLVFGPQPIEIEVSAEVLNRLEADRELVVEQLTEGEREGG